MVDVVEANVSTAGARCERILSTSVSLPYAHLAQRFYKIAERCLDERVRALYFNRFSEKAGRGAQTNDRTKDLFV